MKHLYRNSEVIYCATSLHECSKLFTDDMGESPEDMNDPFEQIPDDEVLDVGSEEPTGETGEEKREKKNSQGTVVSVWWFTKKTAGAWADGFRSGHFSGGGY